MKQQLIQLLKNSRIEEIYLSGFIDEEDGVLEFRPDLRVLFVEFSFGILAFQSTEQYSKLVIRKVDSIEYDADLDEDMSAGVCRASELILDDPDLLTNDIVKMSFYDLEEAENEIICTALGLWLRSGQYIFLDPSFLHGIGIGSNSQEKQWRENLLKETKPSTVEIVVFSD